MEFNFPEGEKWIWVEAYENEVIQQFDENGISRHFSDIDQENLKSFFMVHESGRVFEIPVNHKNNWRLIHFYRCGRTYGSNGTSEIRYPVAGYQVTKDGKNFKVLVALFDDGNTKILYE